MMTTMMNNDHLPAFTVKRLQKTLRSSMKSFSRLGGAGINGIKGLDGLQGLQGGGEGTGGRTGGRGAGTGGGAGIMGLPQNLMGAKSIGQGITSCNCEMISGPL
jgi:hypothetical protein